MTGASPLSAEVVAQAITDLGFLGARLQGLLALSGRLGELHALLAAEQGKRALLADLDQQAAVVREVVAQARDAQERLDNIGAEIEQHLAEARAKADRLVEDAESSAQESARQAQLAAGKIIEEARQSSAKIVQAGRAKADAEAEKHSTEARKRYAQISSLEADIARLTAERARLRQCIDDERLRAGVA